MGASKPVLTLKQEKFCQEYLNTYGNASEAYRRAYDASGMNEASVNREAHTLLRNPKISPRIKAIRDELDESAKVSLSQHLDRLKTLSDLAEKDGQYNAAITAEVNRGKVSGLYIDRVESNNVHRIKSLSDDERIRELEKLKATAEARRKENA